MDRISRSVSRRMARVGSLVVAGSLTLGGCGEGEVTTLILPVSPDNTTQFEAAQGAMLDVGCGIQGCHGTIVGNFQVTGEPATRQDEYLLTKPLIDQELPDQSDLLRVALAGDPAAVGHPVCFANTEGCAWRIVTAWIADPPEDAPDGTPLLATSIAETCTPQASACFTGGD